MAPSLRPSLLLALLAVACGRDVDLGGSEDASAALADACPCAVTAADGAARDSCGSGLTPPSVASPCHACDPLSPTCQKNGCFGGFWCNVAIKDCHPPLATCP